MNNIEEYEKEVETFINEELMNYNAKLRALGVDVRNPHLKRMNENTEDYYSEYEITFFVDDKYYDFIEICIFVQNNVSYNLEQFKVEVQNDLDVLLNKRKLELGLIC